MAAALARCFGDGNPDSDGDGQRDRAEIAAGTNPRNAYSDGDGSVMVPRSAAARTP